MVELLIEEVEQHARPSFLSTQSQFGYTCLHWCALNGHAQVAELLLRERCDPTVTNSRGRTAWDVAQSVHAAEVLDVFEKLAHLEPSHPHANGALRKEKARRDLRPKVDVDTYRDDLELEHIRFCLWDIGRQCSTWGIKVAADGRIVPLAEGGFGKVYLITEVSPPIEVTGRQFRMAVLKVPRQFKKAVDDLKEEVRRLGWLSHQHVVQILGMVHGPEPDGTEAWMMALE